MKEDPVSIGRFQVQAALGRGAMGAIYRAHDPEIDRPVAIKLIRTDLLDGADRAEFIARFRREAQAAGRCTHPNIVAIYDFALHEGNPYLAMEFVDGVTLVQARPADRRFEVPDAIFVVLQVLSALQAAHGAGVVHRDIKPANIMLVGGSQVKVADFGIARLDTSDLTHHEQLIGTPSYMSPEQCRGETVDSRSDLFSMGIVLFEMLTGQKPFAGGHMTEVMSKIVQQPMPDLQALVPGLDAGLCAVIARSLAKSPVDRFATADEMAQALKAAASDSGTAYDDRTIIAPARAVVPESRPTSISSATHFDPLVLDTLSRQLTALVGPIAPFLVQSAVRKAASLEGLYAELESKLDQPADRLAFQQNVRRQLGSLSGQAAGTLTQGTPGLQGTHASSGTASLAGDARAATLAKTQGTGTGVPISAADVERVQSALAQHVGPMARVMVKRALAGATSLPALKEALAAQIDDPQARSAFMGH